MVYRIKIDNYNLGPDVGVGFNQSYAKAKAIVEDLEHVITTMHPEARNISIIFGAEWAQRTFGAVYELPNGVACIDFMHASSGGQAELRGEVAFVGGEGFQDKQDALVERIHAYFKEKGIKEKTEN
jgi:hypothetical protein